MKKNHNSENEFAKGPYTYEVCPHCGEEVELKNELMVQTCPNCGKRIVTCSMCRACDTGEKYCSLCCLDYQAKVENKELGRLPIDIIEDIKHLFRESDADDISFLHHPKKPTITKDGIKYDIVGIQPYVDDDEPFIELECIPHGNWKLENITLDLTSRKATLERIHDIVSDYLYKQGLL